VALLNVIGKFLEFLRANYPTGVNATERVPLLALLQRRLSDGEVHAVASGLAATGELPIDAMNIRVAITRVTDEMPSQADTDRVKKRLVAAGWPVNDRFQQSD
jgi:Protein of unknown function (DUF3349)